MNLLGIELVFSSSYLIIYEVLNTGGGGRFHPPVSQQIALELYRLSGLYSCSALIWALLLKVSFNSVLVVIL